MGDFVGAFGSGSSCTASEVNFIDDRDWCDEGRKTQAKGGWRQGEGVASIQRERKGRGRNRRGRKDRRCRDKGNTNLLETCSDSLCELCHLVFCRSTDDVGHFPIVRNDWCQCVV